MNSADALRGIIAATVLPFSDDGSPDLDNYATFVDQLVQAGVGGLAINADSGEGMSLWPDERRAVMSTAADTVGGRVPLVSGIISSFTAHACELAEEAAADGATHLMVFPNAHLRGQPLDPEVLLRYLDSIHGASGLPVVGFQLQDALGGVEYGPELISEIVRRPYVEAIKESTFDALKFRTTMQVVRSAAPEVSFLSGNDNFIYESFVLGADGALIGAGSIATALQVQMFEAVKRSDYVAAAELNALLEPLMVAIFGPPIRDYRARTKVGLVELGILARPDVREPLLQVPESDRQAVVEGLRHAGLLRGES